VLQNRTHLHGPAFAVAAVVVAALLCGAVYAAVRFAPDFIHILQKDTTTSGRTEYTVGAFADCTTTREPANKFEIKKDAPALSDQEVKKILQARCELDWVSGFVKSTWPTSSTGDTVTYARAETVAQLKSMSDSTISITYQGGESQLNMLAGHTLEVYTSGKKISRDELKPGDAIFPVVRVTEKKVDSQGPDPRAQTGQQPQVLGVIGVLKMSLPYDYYQKMQSYITEVHACYGNQTADCPNTSSIDVYPRAGGEGATNTYFDHALDTASFKEITGTVTELSANQVKLKSSTGQLYTVQLADNGFADYNTTYAPAYHSPEALVKIGSTVSVSYKESEPAATIQARQILRITLLLEMTNPKQDAIKQY
jgi:hypothetical protein